MTADIAKPTLPVAVLRECLHLDANTGRLFWLYRPRSHFLTDRSCKVFDTLFAGREGFLYVGNTGYKQSNLHIREDLHRLLAHRVVWALHTGEWPAETLDHINTDRLDNRPSNLREATYSQNNINRSAMRTNKTGIKGVMATSGGRFVAQISLGGRSTHLGTFDTAEQASAAYARAAAANFGEFART